MKKRTVAFVALLMVVSLLFTACASRDNGNDQATTENQTTTESQTSDDVTMEEENSLSGFAATLAGKAVKEDGTPYKVALMYSDLESEYIIYQSEYMKFLIEAAGGEVTIVTPDQNAEKESSYIDDFIEAGMDCVVVNVVDSNASSTAMKKLNDAGIPLVCVARTVEDADYAFFVSTSDNVRTGEMCMEYMVELAGGNDVSVVSVQGYMGAQDAYSREEGFQNVLADNPNIAYTPNPCDWTSTKAEAAISDALIANPDLFGIVSHSDAMTAGVKSALTQAGKLIKVGEEGHVAWVSIDGAATALDMIRQGYMDAVVDQSPLTNAVITTKGILEYLVPGKTMDITSIDVETQIIDGSNVDEEGWWGDYDIDDAKNGIEWSLTEEVWNSAPF